MLTVEYMESLLERFTYKPGWKFELVEGSMARFWLQYSFKTEDAFNPDRETLIGSREPLPTFYYEEHFWRYLLGIVDKAERHETREWFKVDGLMPYNPHRSERMTAQRVRSG